MNNYITIHQYVKGTGSKKNTNVGVLIGFKFNDKVFISGSKVNLSAGDKFDKKFGIELAKNRLSNLDDGRKVKIAASMEKDLTRFVARCRKYFKIDTVILPELSAH